MNRLMFSGAAITLSTSLLAMWFTIIGVPFAFPYLGWVIAGAVIGIAVLAVGVHRLEDQ